MNINDIVKEYARFLNQSWNNAMPLLMGRDYTTDEFAINDWLQMNWEMLVERKILSINEYFEPYGDGADYNGASCRITDINAIATHKLIGNSNSIPAFDYLNNNHVIVENVVFDRFVGFEEGYYTMKPSFDLVLVYEGNLERVFKLSEIEFSVIKIYE